MKQNATSAPSAVLYKGRAKSDVSVQVGGIA